MNSFDYVIVGAGSAGCVLANRLSADAGNQVALIEAGPPDASPWIHHPLGLQFVLRNPKLEWRLPTLPEPALNGRRIACPRGRTFGGSSSANGMIYIRGQQQDYDSWAAGGCTGWAWNDVLPWFMKAESNDRIAGPLHGVDGPLKVSTVRADSPLCNALIAAGRSLGIPASDDFNGASQEGVGYYQFTLFRGRRWSAARAYLTPVLQRKNLHTLADTQVLRVLFEGGRASGVQLLRGGVKERIMARREVILSAGAIHSPQLLQVSGVGDPAHLASLGIALVADAPQVGLNLQDHLQARLEFRLNAPLSLNDLYHHKGRLALEALRYAVNRSGRMAEPGIRAGMFCRSSAALDRPDLQFHFLEFSSPGVGQPLHRHSGFYLSVCPLRPVSRGEVRATSADAQVPPGIVGNFLSAQEDIDLTLKGVRIARRLAAQPSMAGLIAQENDPGPGVDDDAAMVAWMRGNAVTAYHPSGTCRMGSDALSVVDSELRVRGVNGLRVVDASIMPALVSGNTNAPTIMIAERAADLILRSQLD